jgi:N-acetyl-D-muramate 6-phosphate phosphatase
MRSTTNKVLAVIWDFDGTLVDTSNKNLNVTRKIISHIKPEIDPCDLPALRDLPSYINASLESMNWRDFYMKEFDLSALETDLAGKLWTEFQLEDETEICFFPRIVDVINRLRPIPQGIVSQNSRDNIHKLLKSAQIDNCFREVIGYEEVDLQHQKPHPDGLLKCVELISDLEPGIIYYIGDHETDIACAFHASKILQSTGRTVKSIAAFYRYSQDSTNWKIPADHIAGKETDILDVIPHEN